MRTDEQILRERIEALCAKHTDRKARWRAMKSIHWVLYCAQLNLWAGLRGMDMVPVESMAEAVTFDGRDNEVAKREFYRAVTGIDWQVKLCES